MTAATITTVTTKVIPTATTITPTPRVDGLIPALKEGLEVMAEAAAMVGAAVMEEVGVTEAAEEVEVAIEQPPLLRISRYLNPPSRVRRPLRRPFHSSASASPAGRGKLPRPPHRSRLL